METAKLGTLTKLITRGISPKYVEADNGFVVINQKCIRNNRIDFKHARNYSSDQKAKAGCILKTGDILINSTGIGTLSRSAILRQECENLTFDSHVTLVRPNKAVVDCNYLGYHIELLEPVIENFAVGSTGQTELSRKDLFNLDIILHELTQQRQIASILSNYDKLIEINNQRIKLLEETARELYKEWFVRMRFPGYKNAKFEKGIPEGWEIEKVASAFEILGGGTPSTTNKEFWDGDVNWFTPTDITGTNGIFLETSNTKITNIGLKNSSAKSFPPYSIMMTSRATIGAVGINSTAGCTNQGFITCIPNDRLPYTFLYHWILLNKETFESMASGSTFLEITKGTFKKIDILVPDTTITTRFHKVAKPLFKQIENLQQQNIQLRQIRDRLLPRLISGKLKIKPAEEAVYA